MAYFAYLECFLRSWFTIRIQLYNFVSEFLQTLQYFCFITYNEDIHLIRIDPSFCKGVNFLFTNSLNDIVLLVNIVSRKIVVKYISNKASFLHTGFIA